jgi:DNA polymerase-1
VATSLQIDERRAREIRADYKSAYPGIARIDYHCQSRVKRDGFITLWLGRRRRFQYKSQAYKAMNSLIQGGAADIVERIMIRVWDEIDCDDCQMLLQVHDALVFEIKEERVEEFTERILDVMQDVNAIIPEHIDGRLDVFFKVEASAWAEAA